jgi:hypothetical protein
MKEFPPNHLVICSILKAFKESKYPSPLDILEMAEKYNVAVDGIIWNHILDCLALIRSPKLGEIYQKVVSLKVPQIPVRYETMINILIALLTLKNSNLFLQIASAVLSDTYSLKKEDLQILTNGIDVYDMPHLAKKSWKRYRSQPQKLSIVSLESLLHCLSKGNEHKITDEIWKHCLHHQSIRETLTPFMYECRIKVSLTRKDPSVAIKLLAECQHRRIQPTKESCSIMLASSYFDAETKLEIFDIIKDVASLEDFVEIFKVHQDVDVLTHLWTLFLSTSYIPSPAIIKSLKPLLNSDNLVKELILEFLATKESH